MQLQKIFTACALVLLLLAPVATVVAEEEAPAQISVTELETLLTEILVTPMAASTGTADLAASLNKGPKPIGLCANNGCATTCRDDDDCGAGGNCIYTACF